jgi:threonine aldolase
VIELEQLAADLSGLEAALCMPSGTMANQVAIRCWTEPGDEVIMESGAHPFHYEAGGAAVISGAQIRLIQGERGVFGPETLLAAVRGPDDHYAPARLVSIEDTSNRGGGAVWPLATLDAVCAAAQDAGLKVHMDGARVFNAVVASGVPLRRRARGLSSLSFCLSKGLGAPVGSMLCGSKDMIRKARRVRKMLGGGMRQAGYLAAAGLYALTHNVARLAEDHENAKYLYEGLVSLGYQAESPETNMVYLRSSEAKWLVDRLQEAEIACFAVGPERIRLVVHLDVIRQDLDRALQVFAMLRP